MKQLMTIFILFNFAMSIYAQNGTFFIGDKTFSCSPEYTFSEGKSNSLKFIVVKDANKGMIVFKSLGCRICGTVILYLDNNMLIKLVDRKSFDLVNSEYSSIYYFTETEITTLKSTNISLIRYNECYDDLSGSAHSVNNKDYYFIDKYIIKRVDFPSILKALFN